MCVNTKSRRKDISNDRREAIVAAHQLREGYEAISKPFGVHHSTVGYPQDQTQRNCKKPKSNISDSTGLS